MTCKPCYTKEDVNELKDILDRVEAFKTHSPGNGHLRFVDRDIRNAIELAEALLEVSACANFKQPDCACHCHCHHTGGCRC